MNASDPVLGSNARRELAYCVAKDTDLAAELRYDTAIDILGEGCDLSTTDDQKLLGVAGSIYKGKWRTFILRQDLETALGFYLRGYALGPAGDLGYTGIYAAYLLNVLASLEKGEARRTGLPSDVAVSRVRQADAIRRDLIDKLGPLRLHGNWRFLIVLGTAHFGLREYDAATACFARAMTLPNIGDADYQSVGFDLAAMANHLTLDDGGVDPRARAVVETFLRDQGAGASTSFLGKVGLALSGGGFRASLFHIGVLAKLAEYDMLRHVEVLSCVSGGSIVGAYYYLELKRLLESRTDAEITRDDYIGIVKRIERDFVNGIQSNVRMRIISSLIGNLEMAFNSHHTRTRRAGELYERVLYSRVTGNKDEIWLNELKIRPKGERADFKPIHHNWRRRAKVPNLILNATTLNTGHNWQFTTSWMGEPAAGIDSRVDGNSRLRRMRYEEAPPAYQRMRLGHAVAASACVPGVLEPLVLADLFPDFTVRLVDGGVYDNQGTAALLDQNCTVVLASDASGQMEDDRNSTEAAVGVTLRTSSVLQARLRVAQSRDLADRRRGGLLKGLMFLHMKLDLQSHPVNWIGCNEGFTSWDEPAVSHSDHTSYGIRREVQSRLAAIRTDLDSFNDLESSALMISGYRMAESELPGSVTGFELDPVQSDWQFLKLESCLEPGGTPASQKKYKEAMKLLDVAQIDAFKIWFLIPVLKWSGAALVAAIVVGIVASCFLWAATPLVTAGMVGTFLVSAGATAVLGKHAVRLFQAKTTYDRVLLGMTVGVLAWLFTWIHLLVFDPLYLRYGRRDRFIV